MKITEHQANDGTRFATADECKAHDRATSIKLLENLSQGQVGDAMERKNIKLADAIETAGKLISEKRRAMGGVKRKRKTIDEKAAEGAAIVPAKREETAAMIAEVGAKQAKKK